MPKLNTPIDPGRREKERMGIDVYYHKFYGWLARKWPTQRAPTRSAQWREQSARLSQSWADYRSLPDYIYQAWIDTADGKHKTGLDYLRKASMLAPADRIRITYFVLPTDP